MADLPAHARPWRAPIVALWTSLTLLAQNSQPPAPAADVDPARDLACFMIMAGKDATADGSVMIAHNNDLGGAEAALVERSRARDHGDTARIKFPSGLEIPQARRTFGMLVLRIHEGYAEGDAIAINDHQVAIGGGVALGADRNERAERVDPLIERGLTGGIRYAALQRSRTARECVGWIGRMYTKHGVTYPSGVCVADTKEIWYIEAGGGHCWAAVRIPDDAVWLQANAYRIGQLDLEDRDNCLASPGLLAFAAEHGLWDPESGPFHFARAFGRRKADDEDTWRNTRRVWRATTLLDQDQELPPDGFRLPRHIVPAAKVTVPMLMRVLRDTYEDTPFDVNAEGAPEEYAIGCCRTVHTDVVQLRGELPNDIGGLMWVGMSTAPTAAYVPIYLGIDEVPAAFGTASADFDRDSAFWTFRSLATLVQPYFRHVIADVRAAVAEFESPQFAKQAGFEAEVLELYRTDSAAACRRLTRLAQQRCDAAIALARSLRGKLEVTIAGRINDW